MASRRSADSPARRSSRRSPRRARSISACYLVARGIGDANRNVLVGLSINIILTSFGTAGLPVAREAFLVLGFGFGACSSASACCPISAP